MKRSDNMKLSPKIRTLLNDVADLLMTNKLALSLTIKYVKKQNPDLAEMVVNAIEQTEGKCSPSPSSPENLPSFSDFPSY